MTDLLRKYRGSVIQTNLNTRCADFDKNLQGMSDIFDDCQEKLQTTEHEMTKLKSALSKCTDEYAKARAEMKQTEAKLKSLYESKSKDINTKHDELKESVLDLRFR